MKKSPRLRKWKMRILQGRPGACLGRVTFSGEYLLTKDDYYAFVNNVKRSLPDTHFIESKEIAS